MKGHDIHAPGKRGRASRALLSVLVLAAFAAGALTGVLWSRRGERGPPTGGGAAPAAEAQELWTCGMHPQVLQDHPGLCPICNMALTPIGGAGAGAGTGAVLAIDPAVVQNMGLRVVAAVEAPLARTIRAAGVLAEPEAGRHDVSLRLSGWVDRLHADTEGMRLAQGDPLFDLYSPELQVAVEELIGARKLQGSEEAESPAGALYASAVKKLELYGLARAQVDELAALDAAPRAVTFASPADGYLVERSVYAGSAVAAGDTVLRISDASRMWLDARVFAQDLAHVRVGQEATAEVDGRPGEDFSGKVLLVHPRIDPATRTALVRIGLENPELALRQGMFATAFLRVELAPDAVVVPREAVIDTGVRQLVFVALGAGRFEPRKVEMGASGEDGLVQVLSGLAPGEEVVASGQFLLDAESRTQEAIQRFLGERSGPGAAAPAAEPAHGGHR